MSQQQRAAVGEDFMAEVRRASGMNKGQLYMPSSINTLLGDLQNYLKVYEALDDERVRRAGTWSIKHSHTWMCAQRKLKILWKLQSTRDSTVDGANDKDGGKATLLLPEQVQLVTAFDRGGGARAECAFRRERRPGFPLRLKFSDPHDGAVQVKIRF